MRCVLLPLLLAAGAWAADPLTIELSRPGGTVRIAIDGSAYEISGPAGRAMHQERGAADRDAIRARRAALAAANPGTRIGLVGSVDGAAGWAAQAVVTDRVAIRLPAGGGEAALLARHGLVLVERPDYAPGYLIAAAADGDPLTAAGAADALRDAGIWADLQVRLHRPVRLTPTDPMFSAQWHLTGSAADIDVASVWDSWTGTGVNVAIVDDGVELTHPDLSAGMRTDIDTDVLDGNADPSHVLSGSDEGHGTVVAGLIGARAGNAVGGVGVAFDCGLVGVRLLGSGTTDGMEAQALAYRASSGSDYICVSNNSWGPADDGLTLGAIGALQEAALTTATTSGRGGRGTVVVVAGGNGRGDADSADYDGFASHRRTIGVAAVGPDGSVASYSEPGAGLLIAAPGGEFTGSGIVSTDRSGANGFVSGAYTQASDEICGTSFATPIVSGAVALLLQSRPVLSWRDVPQVLARSARTASGATVNGAGLGFHPDFGFGLLDVQAAVDLAADWVPLPPEASYAASTSASTAIPDNDAAGISRTFDLSAVPADFVVERAAVTVNLTHAYRGDVEFQLVSPANTTAVFSRRAHDGGDNLVGWVFTTVDLMGEGGSGAWTLKAIDREAMDAGTLGACTVTLYGYRPYGLPETVAVFPSAVVQRTGAEADLAIAVKGSSRAVSQGGDTLHGDVRVAATSYAATATDSAWSSITVPASAFTTLGTVAVSVSNPQVPGPGLSGSAGGGFSTAPALITVRAAGLNNAPVLASVTDATVRVSSSTTVGRAAFSDDDGDTLSYRIGTAPTLGTASIDAFTGTVTYASGATAGTDTLTVIASDGIADSAPATITYTVHANTAPALVAVTDAAVAARSSTTTGHASFDDADDDALTYRIGTAPSHGTATIVAATGVVTYTAGGTAGTDALTVIANDGLADSAPATVTYTITASGSGGGSSGGGGDGGGSGGGCGAGAAGLVLLGLMAWRRRRA